MDGDRFFYLMIMVIALIGVGLFAIPVRAHDQSTCATRSCSSFDSAASTKDHAVGQLTVGNCQAPH